MIPKIPDSRLAGPTKGRQESSAGRSSRATRSLHLARNTSLAPAWPIPRPVRLPESRRLPPAGDDATTQGLRLWLAGRTDDATVGAHPYAVREGITWAAGAGRGLASGKVIGQDADCLLVPIRTDGTGKVQAVQCINAHGAKQIFGQVSGGCLVLGNTLDRHIPWYVAEGWASAVSVVFRRSRGSAVCAVAFTKSHLIATAEILERVFNPPEIVVLREVG